MIPASLLSSLRSARHVVVFTGAGVSAESGIPTFRDALTGLWERFDPGELATADAFRRDPALVWGWYEWRRMKVLQARPNPAHMAIAELASHVPQLTLITQNVDDLHERAGSREVIHLHGSLHRPRCSPAPVSRPSRCPHPTNPKPDVVSNRRAAATVADACGQAWSGSARACRAMRCAPPSPLPRPATCCCRSVPQGLSIPPLKCHIWRGPAAPRWCM